MFRKCKSNETNNIENSFVKESFDKLNFNKKQEKFS